MAGYQFAHCQNLKTAIAERIQEIVSQTDRWLADDDESFVKNRLQRGSFDNTTGPNPRKLRYSFAPMEEREYLPILSEGKVDGNMHGRDCTGNDANFEVEVDRTGAYGCDLPGQELHGGFDVFTYEMKGKAFETGWACALDLLLKDSYNHYLEGLQKALRKEMVRHHNWALERDVIALGKYNVSVTTGFTFSEGGFVTAPTGGLNVETIKRQFAMLYAEGWTGPQVVGGVSREAFEEMRATYRAQKGYEIQTTPASTENEFLPSGAEAIEWAGITWVFARFPLRGYLKTVGGVQQFVPVRPTITRAGTGGGVVPEVNTSYYDCRYYCDGEFNDLFEVAFIIHPTEFAKVLSFTMPSVAGKSWSNSLFNMDLRMIDGPEVHQRFGVSNVDNFKFFFRALHAYGFEPINPELAGAIAYRVSPYSPVAVAPTCNSVENPGTATVTIAAAASQEVDGVRSCGDPNAAECAMASYPVFPKPTQEAPCADSSATGTIRFADCSGISVLAQEGTLRVCVERVAGYAGVAEVAYTTTAGTATAGSDYTTTAGTLEWADGEGGLKCIDIPILAAATATQNFTIDLSAFVGAVGGSCDQVTVTFVAP